MSGGAYDYLYYKIEEAGVRLMRQSEPAYRRAFGALLVRCSVAMKDVEWVDSCDKSQGDDEAAIMKCISHQEVLSCSVERAEEIMKELRNIIEVVALIEVKKKK